MRLGIHLAAAAAIPSLATAQSYTIEDLSPAAGASAAYAVNAAGHVAGYTQGAANAFVAFRWDGALHTYGPVLQDTQTHALDINGLGQAVAVSFTVGVPGTNGIRVQGGTITSLGPLAPRGINAAGAVVGSREAVLPDGWRTEEAILWQGGGDRASHAWRRVRLGVRDQRFRVDRWFFVCRQWASAARLHLDWGSRPSRSRHAGRIRRTGLRHQQLGLCGRRVGYSGLVPARVPLYAQWHRAGDRTDGPGRTWRVVQLCLRRQQPGGRCGGFGWSRVPVAVGRDGGP